MAIRNLRFNDDPVIRKRCKEVTNVGDKIRIILEDMMETLRHTKNGAALAANETGILKRLVVVDYYDYLLKLVNPKIIGYSGVQECVEGCLSFPGRIVKTICPQKVTIQAFNEWGRRFSLRGKMKWQSASATN